MENLYAIYTYKFIENKDPGDLFQDGQSKATDMSTAQDVFYGLFLPQNNLFRVQKVEGDYAKKYTCEVYGNDSRMVALRLFNMKEEHYWEIVEKPHDPMGAVERKSLTSTPCTFVIIDCRPNKKILAVKVETEAWRNTDVVRDLMEESINLQLNCLKRSATGVEATRIGICNESRLGVKCICFVSGKGLLGHRRHKDRNDYKAENTEYQISQ